MSQTNPSATPMPQDAADDVGVIKRTRAWVDRAVIGLNLCPFAKAPQAKGQVRYVVSRAGDPAALLADLIRELETLAEANPEKIETTLLIHPGVLQNFATSRKSL